MADRRLCRRNPFEEMPAGNEQPRQGPPDRVAHQPCLVTQDGDEECPLGERDAQLAAKGRQMAAWCYPGMARQDGRHDRDDGWQKDRRKNEADPHARSGEGQGQSCQQRQHACWSGQCSPEVVEHLPATDRWDTWPETDQPWQQLPIAARPAVLAPRGDVVAGGEFLDNLDIGREASKALTS